MRSVIALDPRLFGRGRIFNVTMSRATSQPILSEDFKLFAMTFAGAFLFVAIYLG